MKIISGSEAKRRGLKRYYTGRPCKHGHVAERWVNNKTCIACNRVTSREWRAANPEKQRAADRVWYAAHPDKNRAWRRAWREANPNLSAAINGLNGARQRYPGCVPPDF